MSEEKTFVTLSVYTAEALKLQLSIQQFTLVDVFVASLIVRARFSQEFNPELPFLFGLSEFLVTANRAEIFTDSHFTLAWTFFSIAELPKNTLMRSGWVNGQWICGMFIFHPICVRFFSFTLHSLTHSLTM